VEERGILKKNPVNIAHLPTLMLAIGYPLYWAEMMGLSRNGVTSPLACGLFLFFAIFVLVRERGAIASSVGDFAGWLSKCARLEKWLYGGVFFFMAVILVCSLYASLLPPHLMQEGDALNYHYTLSRQHLILHSFDRIPWSGFDLFFLPVDFALAPYWFATALPNKISQFIFLAGLVLIVISLVRYVRRDGWEAAVLAAALLLGSHGHGIQMGTAMLDLANTYLFLAAIDSFLKRAHWLFILEANFYLWSKSFVPVQTLAIVLVLLAIVVVLCKAGWKELLWEFQKPWTPQDRQGDREFLRQCAVGFLAVSLLVGGPFVAKSMAYAGTPLYPFATGLFTHPKMPDGSVAWQSIREVAHFVGDWVRNNYGYGRSLLSFVRHFWLIAVPTEGVNNAFDYPLGLTYLLSLGPFLFLTVEAFRKRQIPVLPLVLMLFWGSWWFGSQQSRWLFIPVCLMFIAVAARLKKPSVVLWLCVIAALGLNTVSIVHAHKRDWGKTRLSVLREQDRRLADLSQEYVHAGRTGLVETDQYEAAFAQFPIVVRKESLPNAVAF
jgi:hypothetical protein